MRLHMTPNAKGGRSIGIWCRAQLDAGLAPSFGKLASPNRRHVWFDSRAEAERCVLVVLYIFRDNLAQEYIDVWSRANPRPHEPKK